METCHFLNKCEEKRESMRTRKWWRENLNKREKTWELENKENRKKQRERMRTRKGRGENISKRKKA